MIVKRIPKCRVGEIGQQLGVFGHSLADLNLGHNILRARERPRP